MKDLATFLQMTLILQGIQTILQDSRTILHDEIEDHILLTIDWRS